MLKHFNHINGSRPACFFSLNFLCGSLCDLCDSLYNKKIRSYTELHSGFTELHRKNCR